MSQLEFDESMAERLESLGRTGDVLRRRRLVLEALAAAPGERVLDVGCGPGFYVDEILEQVGPEGGAVGIDMSPHMLAIAERRTAGRGNVEFRQGNAISLPVADGEFDAAVCVQVLEYVPDATGALAEMHRALRSGGRVVVWDVDWATVSWHSSDADRMRRVLRAFDEHLAHPSLPSTLVARLAAAGLDGIEVAGHPFVTARLDHDAYGAAIIPLITDFVPGRRGVTGEEVTAWAADQRELGDRGEFFFACIQFCFTASKP